MGAQPLYRVKFVGGGPYDGLYYAGDQRWQGVVKEAADKLTHKEARKVQGHLKRPKIRLATVLEPVNQ